MRSQKVSVDVWKMIVSSCSYLAVAFMAWVFLKLAYACFWFPGYLQRQHDKLSVKCKDNVEVDEKTDRQDIDKKQL